MAKYNARSVHAKYTAASSTRVRFFVRARFVCGLKWRDKYHVQWVFTSVRTHRVLYTGDSLTFSHFWRDDDAAADCSSQFSAVFAGFSCSFLRSPGKLKQNTWQNNDSSGCTRHAMHTTTHGFADRNGGGI